MKKIIFVLSLLFVIGGCQQKQTTDAVKHKEVAVNNYEWFEKGVKNHVSKISVLSEQPENISHMAPEVLFGYANFLFLNEEKEKSVFVFYLAQLRARILLSVLKEETPLSILYDEVLSALGPVINGWVGAYPDIWIEQMKAALEYENSHPFSPHNLFSREELVSEQEIEAAVKKQKEGLRELITFVEENKDAILKHRQELN